MPSAESKSRALASIALLSALGFVLRITVEFPFPLASYLKLEVWEIPTYLALFMYGLRRAIAVAFVVFLLVQALATGLPLGPLYNLIAVLSTMLGVAIVVKLAGRGVTDVFRSAKIGLASVASSALTRILLMTVVNAIILPRPFPVGFNIPESQLPALLAVTALFNGTVAAYSTAIAIGVAARIAPLITGMPLKRVETPRPSL